METITIGEPIDFAPRGKNQRARFFQDHVRPGEELYVVVLPNGRFGKHRGSIVATTLRATLERFETEYRDWLRQNGYTASAGYPEWDIQRVALPAGLRIDREPRL